jgi:hypothetical protein
MRLKYCFADHVCECEVLMSFDLQELEENFHTASSVVIVKLFTHCECESIFTVSVSDFIELLQ